LTRDDVDDGQGKGGEGGSGGGPAIGPACEKKSDCPTNDDEHCTTTCEEVDSEKRCVTVAVDADGDEHGTTECEGAPGDDCDDADAISYPGGPAVTAVGKESCALLVGDVCGERGQTIVWNSEGTPVHAYADRATGTYGSIVAYELDELGLPSGEAIQWAAPSGLPITETAQIYLAPKDAPSAYGLLWASITGNAGYTDLRFSTVSTTANSTLSSVQINEASVVGAYTGLLLSWLGSSWATFSRFEYAGADTSVSAGTALSVSIPDAAEPAIYNARHLNTAVVAGRRMIVGLNENYYNNPYFVPSLVIQLYSSATGASQLGSDVVLIDDAAASRIAPRVTIGTFNGKFLVFYRDDVTSLPLTARVLDTNGNTVGTEQTYDSEVLPLGILDLSDKGGVLIGSRVNGDKSDLVAQIFNAALAFVGEPVLLSDALPAEPAAVSVQGAGLRGSVTYSAAGSRYRLFRLNSCAL